MAHLIPPLHGHIKGVRDQLQAEHDRVATTATSLAVRLSALSAASWGVTAKRLVDDITPGQPLGELVNQLATVERLLDALALIADERPDARVSCNPTTSNIGPDLTVEGDPTWWLEVSDVAVARNNNRKLEKDLLALRFHDLEHTGVRRFLVVSPEWTEWLRARSLASWRRHGCEPAGTSAVRSPIGANQSGVVELRPSFNCGAP